jgi:sRNA-binding protein
LTLDAANNAAIHAKQLADADAEHDAARKIQLAQVRADANAEAVRRVADASKKAAAARVKLFHAEGILDSSQVVAETEKKYAAIDLVVVRELSGEISSEQAYAEFKRISDALPDR